VRLNAYLARAGVASRRGADELIKAGRVTVDGVRASSTPFVEGTSVVRVDGREVGKQALRTSSSTSRAGRSRPPRPERRPTVVDLVGGDSASCRWAARRDTTGVLLLTNDGPLAHRLAHPRYGVEKTYVAEVEGEPGDDVAASARGGRRARGRPHGAGAGRRSGRGRSSSCSTRAATGRCSGCSRPSATRASGCRRPRYAVWPGRLRPGEWRELTRDEVRALRRLVG
jgi:23S rRNA pseudouridine2605 synthase